MTNLADIATTPSDLLPEGYLIARHDLNPDGVRFDVTALRPRARIVTSVRVRRWAGEWVVSQSPQGGVAVGGVLRRPDDAQAIAAGLIEGVHAARRGNTGGRP